MSEMQSDGAKQLPSEGLSVPSGKLGKRRLNRDVLGTAPLVPAQSEQPQVQ
jgi:hypothetical protein